MKEAKKNSNMGFVLFLLSIVLGIIILPAGLIFGVIKCFWKRHFDIGLQNLNKKFYTLAEALDIYANRICHELFDATLITKQSKHVFGDKGETISMVVATNYYANTLTGFGKLLAIILIYFKDTAFKTR